MAFLLGINHRNDGFTVIEYDHTPTQRIQLLSLTDQVHNTIAVRADDLFAHTLSTERPPARIRATKKGSA